MNYDFPITLAPIKTEDLLIPKKLAVIRTDTREPIGVVSNQYSLLRHETVIDSIRKVLGKNKYEEKIEVCNNGARLFATYKLPEIQYEVVPGDFVSMQFVAKNSYDGSRSFSLMLGAFRLVCSNGMVIGKELFNYSQKHIGEEIIIDSDDFLKKFEELIAHFKESMSIMNRMSKTRVIVSDDLYDEEKLMLPKYLIEKAKDAFTADTTNTVWSFYNSLTFAITHSLKKDRPEARIDYTKRAWANAIKLLV